MFYFGLESDTFTQMLTQFDFGAPDPYFDEKSFGANPRLSLLPMESIACGGKVLMLEKHTGSWCFLEPRESEVFRSLDGRELGDIVAGVSEACKAELKEFIARLYWRGLLAINGRRFIEPNVFDSGPIFQSGWLFIIVPTERCNLACKYCCAKSNPQRQERMDWQTAKKAIDLIIDYVPERGTVEFAGGEVFLEWDLIEQIVEYGRQAAEQAGRSLTFTAQSNGTLLTPNLLERLRDLDITVGLSLDGDRISNDMTRVFPGNKGTHAAITQTITLMQEMGWNPGTICVVSRANYRRLDKILAEYARLGETGIKLNPVTRNGRAQEEWEELALEPEEFLEFHKEYLDMVSNGDSCILEENTSTMIEILGTRLRPYRCMRSQCGWGQRFYDLRAEWGCLPLLPDSSEAGISIGKYS